MTLPRVLSWAALAVLGALAVLFYCLQRPLPPLTESLPNPNGFTEIVAVEAAWAKSPPTNDTKGSAESTQLRSRHLALVPQLHEALSHESQMPLATVREAYHQNPDTFGATKQLFIGLNELATSELVAGRVTEARKIWCDALRLAPARYRGGVLIHYLVALAGERRTVETIRAHLDELPTAEQLELATTLRQTGTSWEPLDTLFLRDRTLGLELYGPLERTAFRLSSVLSNNLRKMQQHTEKTVADEAARRGQLLRELEGKSAPDPQSKP